MIYAIVGSRKYKDRWKVKQFIDHLSASDTIVSGGADGPDKLAAHYGKKKGCTVVEYKPDYSLGKLAPLVRNIHIAQGCDEMIAFWDGESTGTLDAIKKAVLHKKEVRIIP